MQWMVYSNSSNPSNLISHKTWEIDERIKGLCKSQQFTYSIAPAFPLQHQALSIPSSLPHLSNKCYTCKVSNVLQEDAKLELSPAYHSKHNTNTSYV